MKLQSVPGFPSQVVANGLLTHFVRNLTTDGTCQIARVLGEHDHEVLFQGTHDQCEQFLHLQVEKDYPGLMNQP